jgi:Protein of unknown function (DUF2384)
MQGKKFMICATLEYSERVRLFDALAEVVPASQIGPWLDTPNPGFEGSTPLQVIERGESDRLGE